MKRVSDMHGRPLAPLNESVGCADPIGLSGRLAVKRQFGFVKKPRDLSKIAEKTRMETSPRTLPGDKTSSFQFDDDDERMDLESTIILGGGASPSMTKYRSETNLKLDNLIKEFERFKQNYAPPQP
jgi:hypothetical protein